LKDFWYGYGTGGTQQKTLSESGFYNSATGKNDAAVDLNGDGDKLDTVLAADSSVTQTQRPGVTGSIKYQLGDHEIFTGVWYERAKHRQTGPAVLVDANGNMADDWLRSNWIVRPDGSPYESRDWNTISTAYQFFAQDTFSLLNEAMLINFGVRTPHIERDFTNYASEAIRKYQPTRSPTSTPATCSPTRAWQRTLHCVSTSATCSTSNTGIRPRSTPMPLLSTAWRRRRSATTSVRRASCHCP
jgi:iron complex outermembrane receptor protein